MKTASCSAHLFTFHPYLVAKLNAPFLVPSPVYFTKLFASARQHQRGEFQKQDIMAPWSRIPKTDKSSSLNTSASDIRKEDADTAPTTTAVQDHDKTAVDPHAVNTNEPSYTEDLKTGEKMDKVKTSDTEDNIVYPTGIKLVLILVALCLSVFLVALDQTIIATAIPKM